MQTVLSELRDVYRSDYNLTMILRHYLGPALEPTRSIIVAMAAHGFFHELRSTFIMPRSELVRILTALERWDLIENLDDPELQVSNDEAYNFFRSKEYEFYRQEHNQWMRAIRKNDS